MNDDRIREIAETCHEVNRAYCRGLGDLSQEPWDDSEDWQRESAIAGVRLHINNRNLGPSASHDAWLEHKKADGWKHVRTSGSHRQYRHSAKPGLVTIPGQMNDDLAPGTLNSILKQAGLKS